LTIDWNAFTPYVSLARPYTQRPAAPHANQQAGQHEGAAAGVDASSRHRSEQCIEKRRGDQGEREGHQPFDSRAWTSANAAA
jgi:hypothetical protein